MATPPLINTAFANSTQTAAGQTRPLLTPEQMEWIRNLYTSNNTDNFRNEYQTTYFEHRTGRVENGGIAYPSVSGIVDQPLDWQPEISAQPAHVTHLGKHDDKPWFRGIVMNDRMAVAGNKPYKVTFYLGIDPMFKGNVFMAQNDKGESVMLVYIRFCYYLLTDEIIEKVTSGKTNIEVALGIWEQKNPSWHSFFRKKKNFEYEFNTIEEEPLRNISYTAAPFTVRNESSHITATW